MQKTKQATAHTNPQLRQGDVFLQPVNTLPSGKRVPRKNGVLAYGEVTGHSHTLADLEAAEVYEINGKMFLSVTSAGVSIVHQEHGPIVVPQGDYEVRIQQEYTPKGIVSVVD